MIRFRSHWWNSKVQAVTWANIVNAVLDVGTANTIWLPVEGTLAQP